jgi:Glycosyl transferase family 90
MTSPLIVAAATVPVSRRPFDGFAVRKQAERIEVHDFGGYETRNQSTFKLLSLALNAVPALEFPWVLVNTGDRDAPNSFEGHRVFSYSTQTRDYRSACPDFVFDHWKQTQLDDYEAVARELAAVGTAPPRTNRLGWRGANTNPVRAAFARFTDRNLFDVELISWNRSDPERLTSNNFMSLSEQVRDWRYLIDVEGVGYSGRLKLLFFSRRVVFLQQRPFEEWYFPDLVPWLHYVPVARDLSDLVPALNRLRDDPELEQKIVVNAFEFAAARLTRAAAIRRWIDLLAACRESGGA